MPKKFPVTVRANNPSVTLNRRTNSPVPTQEFKDWMKANNTGRVTTSGWNLVDKGPGKYFTVTWYFASSDLAMLFKLTWV